MGLAILYCDTQNCIYATDFIKVLTVLRLNLSSYYDRLNIYNQMDSQYCNLDWFCLAGCVIGVD